MILFLNCWILLSLITCHVKTLSVELNPIKMISSGMTQGTVIKIMKELLLTENYEALLQILKYPTYNFSEPYETSVCLILTVEIVKNIINTVNLDDQIILLSDQCICKAYNLWWEITVEEVTQLPVNPMSASEFSPLLVAPVIFEAVIKEALKNYSNDKMKPIDFYSWLNYPRVNAQNYFHSFPSMAKMIPSFMNGYMFHGACVKHQIWLLNIIQKRINDLINFAVIGPLDNSYWIEIFKVFIVLNSIYATVDFNLYPEERYLSIPTYIKLIVRYCEEFSPSITNEFGLRVSNIISNFKTITLSEVVQVLFDSGEDFHPDWFIGLLMCKLTSTSEDYRNILFYISRRNPHYRTIETISTLMVTVENTNIFNECKTFFKEETLLQNPDVIIWRPLQWRFRDLRSKLLPFPMFYRHELIAGLLDAPREPQELLRDIVNDFYEKYQTYTNQMTSIVVTSFTKSGKIRVVDSLTMLYKALDAFLQLPEYYTVTSKGSDGRVELIFNPLLPTKYIQIIMNLIIHLALLGGPVPFKIHEEYFKQCLKGLNDNLLDIYEDYSSDFLFMYSKISQATDSNDWYSLPNYMSYILENYNEISMLSDDLVRISPVPERVSDWLRKSFMENASMLRVAVRTAFSIFRFTISEIYYILFK